MGKTKQKSTVSQKDYQAEYYKKNKEKIAGGKADRYRKDTDYRESIRDKAKVRAAKVRAERTRKRVENNKTLGGRCKDIFINDTKVVLYSTASVASYTSVSSISIKNWIDDGVLPPPTLQIGSNAWFSREYLEMVKNVMLQAETISLGSEHIKNKISRIVEANYNSIKEYEEWVKSVNGNID